jgi:small ligand-binding sensory domain FIST
VTGDLFPQADGLLHTILRVTGARALVGCSGAGVLTDRGEAEEASAVAVLVVDDPRLVVTPFLVPGPGPRPGGEVAARVESTLAEGGTLLLLPDPVGLEPRTLLADLEETLGPVPVVGGVAAGSPFFELHGAEVVSGGLAGLAVGGTAPVIGVAQGCMPIGAPYVVTRAEGNLVHEIGSRPALDVLREAIATLPEPAERIRRAGLFAGLAMDPAKSPLERGDFLVRNLLGVDQSSGAVAVAEGVRVGQTIQFQIRDAEASREDLGATLAAVRAALGSRRPAFCCYFNCAGRGAGLFGQPDHDVALIRQSLGDFPLIGFFGNGELAPVGRRNHFHTYTGALVVFPG